ncbi:MAG: alpha-amylase [Prochlorothrix sp.]
MNCVRFVLHLLGSRSLCGVGILLLGGPIAVGVALGRSTVAFAPTVAALATVDLGPEGDRRGEAAIGGLSQPLTETETWVHLFEWSWRDIAQECETVLGPAGIAAVQISPPQEHRVIVAPQWNPAVQFPWFQRYQPVSYRLESRSGSRAELVEMVERCDRAGVKILADAVLNHMVGYDACQGYGSGGSGFDTDRWLYPQVPYDRSAFHDPCGIEAVDYLENADRVQNCQLLGLQDLKTADPAVQAKQAAYLNDLLALGVAGFRIDGAKHMPAVDIGALLAQVQDLNPRVHGPNQRPIVFQEVINTRPEAVTPEPYLANGAVTEFRYGQRLGQVMRRGNWQDLSQIGQGPDWLPSQQAVVFIHNHDNQRGHGAGGFEDLISWFEPADGGKLFSLALVFTWAWPYGTPCLTSSYDWARDWVVDVAENGEPGQRRDLNDWVGPPSDAQGRTLPIACGEGWICEHRRSDFLALVRFRQGMGTAPVNHWWSGSAGELGDGAEPGDELEGQGRLGTAVKRVAFGRGDRGFVLLNGEADPWVARVPTALPAGDYRDWLTGEIGGELAEGSASIGMGDQGENPGVDWAETNSADQAEDPAAIVARVDAQGYLIVTVPPEQGVVLARP